MTLFLFLVLFSSVSFLTYGITYFTGTQMKEEFKRFNLEKLGLLTIILEILGAIGLVVGYFLFMPFLLLSSGGLAVLMFMGVIVRIRCRDSFRETFPALFFMLLNGYIFYLGIVNY